MKVRGIIESINNDGTVDISLIDEDMTVLKGVVVEQVSASSSTERGEIVVPEVGDVALLEGNKLTGFTVTGFQPPIKNNSFINKPVTAGDKIIYGSSGSKLELLSGGILRLFINHLTQLFLTPINNAIHFILERLSVVSPNLNFLMDSEHKEVTLKFQEGSETTSYITFKPRLLQLDMDDKVSISFDTSGGTVLVDIKGSSGESRLSIDSTGIVTFDKYTRVNFGTGANQPLLKAYKLAYWLSTHTHPPNSPPVTPLPTDIYTTDIFIK